MKELLKKCIRPAGFSVLALFALTLSYRALSWKDTMGAYLSSAQELYATDRNLIDVLFVGSSHCYAGVNPDVLWRDYGIAAFDMAISGQDAAAAYHYTKEALKRQKPQIVAVDLLATLYEEGVESNTWRNMLSMRTSANQLAMVRDETADPDKRADYALKWPIIHTRYREVGAHDFVPNRYSRYGRGYCYRFEAEPFLHDPELDSVTEAAPLSDRNRRWIEDFAALAEKKGFSLLFLQIPHEMLPDEKRIYNGVLAYLAGTGRSVLPAEAMIAGAQLNTGSDYLDQGHLNAYGGEKLSDYLGDWLLERFDLADHRGDPAYRAWEDSLTYAEHLYLEQALAQTDGPGAYFSRLAGVSGLTIALALDGDYASSDFDLAGAVRQIGVKESFFAQAGLAVVSEGSLTGYLTPDSGGDLRLDVDALHTLRAAAAESDARWEIELDGARQFEGGYDGLAVLVWDRRLEKIIGKRIF